MPSLVPSATEIQLYSGPKRRQPLASGAEMPTQTAFLTHLLPKPPADLRGRSLALTSPLSVTSVFRFEN